jgi:hypothetical protein
MNIGVDILFASSFFFTTGVRVILLMNIGGDISFASSFFYHQGVLMLTLWIQVVLYEIL